jgi:hypothetical protein
LTRAPHADRCVSNRNPRSEIIARQQNTFAKRQREVAKKAKAEAKRVRRNERKNAPETQAPPESLDFDREPPDSAE